jgi:hypothetical protein
MFKLKRIKGLGIRKISLPLCILLLGLASPPEARAQISPFTSENGQIALSVDAIGTNSASGMVQVQKPAGATVRKAYLFAATTPNGGTITNTDITINGNPVTFTATVANPFPFGTVNSYRGDVTALVKPTIDAAPAGVVNFTISENGARTSSIDGEILAVIFDDPSQMSSNTIVLLFGAQSTGGDTFRILLANPINLAAPGFRLDMSLGISFGFQGTDQFSRIDVSTNTRAPARLTTSAGGQDDGENANGALITVGGLGDLNDNPPNPNALPTNPRSDDELYNLIPFVNNGDTNIDVTTVNPSNDDNIFFAALVIGANTAVVGEGIVLSPVSATNPTGSPHTLTATVQNANGDPIVNRAVTFRVISGPNMNLTGMSNTNSSGQATFTYTSTVGGTDTIEACFQNSSNQQSCSNQVTKTWMASETGNVCHKGRTLTVALNSFEYRRHLDHGDTVGSCVPSVVPSSPEKE